MAEEQETTENLEDKIEEATEAVAVQANELEELEATGESGAALGLNNLTDVPVKVTVEVGRTRSTFNQLMKLGPGALIELDRDAHEPADVLVNGKIVASGEIVTIGDRYGVRITNVLAD